MKINNISLWILIIVGALFFFVLELNTLSKLLLAIFLIVLMLVRSSINKKDYSNKLLENVGIGMLGGLIVSLFRDFAANSFDPTLISMYIVVFVLSGVFILMGILGKE